MVGGYLVQSAQDLYNRVPIVFPKRQVAEDETMTDAETPATILRRVERLEAELTDLVYKLHRVRKELESHPLPLEALASYSKAEEDREFVTH